LYHGALFLSIVKYLELPHFLSDPEKGLLQNKSRSASGRGGFLQAADISLL